MSKPVILLGGGGHARVLLAVLRRLGVTVLGIVDPNLPAGSQWLGLEVLGGDAVVFNHLSEQVDLVNGIGSLPADQGLRERLFKMFRGHGYGFRTLVDPHAFVADDAELAEGVQAMPGVIIQTGAKIAENCIINSGAIIEHDCRVGKHVHVAPGAALSGGVDVGDHVHIGTGAVVIQGIRIGAHSVIGAGSVVTQDVAVGQIVYPARSLVQPRKKDA